MQEPRFQAIPHRRRRELFILFMAGVREAAGLPALPSDHGLDASGGTAVISVGAKASTAAGGALGGSSMAPVVDLGRIEMLRKEQVRRGKQRYTAVAQQHGTPPAAQTCPEGL